ncbi:MAG: colanic acid biosynthesis acetyltransferase WcaF [Phycisphaerales bacterium]|nr:colanic acid biosynthesis acetyltransferase WcaF [Phycisphaerales bacterium]
MTHQPRVDISKTPSPHSLKNRIMRVLWGVVQATLFRHSLRPMHRWRAFLLRLFGADITMKSRVYPKAKVWGPWNLSMGDFATLADDVDCYCVDRITIGAHTTISQYTYLCGATHDFELTKRPLTPMPITIGEGVWIAADVFVGPGVTIGDHTVVGARSSVFSDLPAWKVCVGSPAKPIRDRILKDAPNTVHQPTQNHEGGHEE